MAKTKVQALDDAIAALRHGKSVRECEKLTGIHYSKISREAKKRGVKKGDLQHLVASIVEDKENIATLSATEQQSVATAVDERTRHIQFITNATLKNLSEMMKKVNKETSHQEHKFAQETINKGGEALGVIDKGGTTINNTAQAAVVQKPKTIEDFYGDE